MSDPVIFADLETSSGHILGHAELSIESTLNSLSLDMVRLLRPALKAWGARDEVVAVVITAAGDRAFCAGGDIQALYRAIDANHEAGSVVNDYPFRFFEEEYRLDYEIHQFPKPLVTLGHGIVMGGGNEWTQAQETVDVPSGTHFPVTSSLIFPFYYCYVLFVSHAAQSRL